MQINWKKFNIELHVLTIEECRGLTCEERLKVSGLTTLTARRDRGDMIEVFKIMKGLEHVDYKNIFQLETTGRTRGQRYKIVKKRSKLDIRKSFFSQRIVNKWNELPPLVVEADLVNSFKNRYDKVISDIEI